VDRGLITGAASGIGAALAERLTANGMRLALLDRVPAQAPGAVVRVADVRDAAAVTAAVDQMAAELGGLDVAFVNAGIGNMGPAHLMDAQAAEDNLEINLLGAWRTTRAVLPHLIASRGHLLLNASLSAVIPAPGLAAYSASKAGVEALGRAIRPELAHRGVTVGLTYYGFLATPLVNEVLGNDAYKAVREIPVTIAQMPCYCHCDRSFGHKSLYSCFQDEHASHCAVCVNEALLAFKLEKEGKSAPEIREQIMETFGN